MGFSLPKSFSKGKCPVSSPAANPDRIRTSCNIDTTRLKKAKKLFKLGAPSDAELQREYSLYAMHLWENFEGEINYAHVSASDVGDADEECEKDFLMGFKKDDFGRADEIVENTRGPYPRYYLRQTTEPVRKTGGQLGSLADVQAQYQQEHEHIAMFAAETESINYEVLFDAEDAVEDAAPVVTVENAAVVEQFKRLLAQPGPKQPPLTEQVHSSASETSNDANETLNDSVKETALNNTLAKPLSVNSAPKRACGGVRIRDIDFLPGLAHLTMPTVRKTLVSFAPKARQEVQSTVTEPVLPGEDFHFVAANTDTVTGSFSDDFQALGSAINASFNVSTDTDSENQHAVDLSVSSDEEDDNGEVRGFVSGIASIFDAHTQKEVGYTALNQLFQHREEDIPPRIHRTDDERAPEKFSNITATTRGGEIDLRDFPMFLDRPPRCVTIFPKIPELEEEDTDPSPVSSETSYGLASAHSFTVPPDCEGTTFSNEPPRIDLPDPLVENSTEDAQAWCKPHKRKSHPWIKKLLRRTHKKHYPLAVEVVDAVAKRQESSMSRAAAITIDTLKLFTRNYIRSIYGGGVSVMGETCNHISGYLDDTAPSGIRRQTIAQAAASTRDLFLALAVTRSQFTGITPFEYAAKLKEARVEIKPSITRLEEEATTPELLYTVSCFWNTAFSCMKEIRQAHGHMLEHEEDATNDALATEKWIWCDWLSIMRQTVAPEAVTNQAFSLATMLWWEAKLTQTIGRLESARLVFAG